MKQFILLFTAVLTSITVFAGGKPGATQALAQAVSPLTAVSFMPEINPSNGPLFMLRDKVKEKSKGELTIKYIGGPEAIRMFEQGTAVKDGVVDMAFTVGAFYKGLVPSARLFSFSQYSPAEERRLGIYDKVRDMHQKSGLFYLGRTGASNEFYHLYTREKFNSIRDLKGKRITGPPQELYKALGNSVVRLSIPEYYTALERGVIDATALPLPLAAGMHLEEAAKFMFDWGFWTGGQAIIMNLRKWNSLPKHLQDLLIQAESEVEVEWAVTWKALEAKAYKQFINAGVKVIEISSAEKTYLKQLMYDAEWNALLKKNPELAPLRELFTRK